MRRVIWERALRFPARTEGGEAALLLEDLQTFSVLMKFELFGDLDVLSVSDELIIEGLSA